jgi:hypothetical protein
MGSPPPRRSAGVVSLFSALLNFPLFFGCSGGFNSLIFGKIPLIRRVTNLTHRYLKYLSLFGPNSYRFSLNSRFSLYLASTAVGEGPSRNVGGDLVVRKILEDLL